MSRWIKGGICLALAGAALAPSSFAQTATYAVGARVECDGTQNHTYYRPGVVIPFQPGDGFNGHDPASGYFYRIRMDGGDPGGVLCRAEDMRPAAAPAAAKPAAAPPAARPAAAPAPTPPRPAAPAAPPPPAVTQGAGKRAAAPCPTQAKVNGGAPALALAKTLIKCRWEGTSDNIYTINFDWESATLGTPRPWRQSWSGGDMGTGVPGSTMVYPVVGQWVTRTYSSSGVVTVETKGTHNCFINAVHVWECGLADSTELKRSETQAR